MAVSCSSLLLLNTPVLGTLDVSVTTGAREGVTVTETVVVAVRDLVLSWIVTTRSAADPADPTAVARNIPDDSSVKGDEVVSTALQVELNTGAVCVHVQVKTRPALAPVRPATSSSLLDDASILMDSPSRTVRSVPRNTLARS